MSEILYTESLPPDLQAKVQRIVARSGCKAFCTAAFTGDENSAQTGDITYLESRQQDNGLWCVKQIKTKPAALYGDDDNDEPEEVKTVRHDLCFFDALYYCAKYENAMDELDVPRDCDNPRAGIMPHIKEVARMEKIPFERRERLPAPVAEGEILIDGVFTRKDRDKAAAVTDNLAGPADGLPAPNISGGFKANAAMMVRLPENIPVPAVPVDLDKTGNYLSRLEKHYNCAERQTNRLVDSFNLVTEKNGASIINAYPEVDGVNKFALGVFTGSTALTAALLPFAGVSIMAAACAIIGAGGMLSGITLGLLDCAFENRNPAYLVTKAAVLPHRAFARDLKSVRKEAGRFPENTPQREAGLWLADQMEQAYHTLAVHYAFNNVVKKGGYWTKHMLSSRTAALEKAYERQGFTQADINIVKSAIEHEYYDQNKYQSFEQAVISQLEDKFREYQDVMRQCRQQDKKRLPGMAR